jgi:hypothetical protein
MVNAGLLVGETMVARLSIFLRTTLSFWRIAVFKE